MYTLRDIVTNNMVTLASEFDLILLEEVNGVTVRVNDDETKVVKIHVGLFAYLFTSSLKNIIKAKVQRDLGFDFKVKFAI